jgi:hypothetical protein
VRSKTEQEQTWANILKAARTVIRLKHSLLADQELNAVLPQLEVEYMAALKAGKAYEFDVASVLDRIEDEV